MLLERLLCDLDATTVRLGGNLETVMIREKKTYAATPARIPYPRQLIHRKGRLIGQKSNECTSSDSREGNLEYTNINDSRTVVQ